MNNINGVIKFLIFIALVVGVVLLSDYSLKRSDEKASRRSEYAVIEQIMAGQEDLGESELVREFNQKRIKELHDHFHHFPVIQDVDQEHQSQCLMCHSLLPHSKNEKIRVMMNLHSDFLNCESCHYKKDRRFIRYEWYDMGIDNEITRGPNFGVRYDPESGMLEGTDNHISKITPYELVAGRWERVFMPQSDPMAIDYLNVKDKLTPGQRDQAKKKFHGDIADKGWECKECHRKEGLLDLKSLGFSDPRIKEIENLEIVGMFEKYDVFHLPQW